MPEVVWQKAEYIRQAGNVAVHGNKHTCAGARIECGARAGASLLLGGSHLSAEGGGKPSTGRPIDESLVSKLEPGVTPASVEELETHKSELDAAEDARKELEGELEALHERLAAIKAENETIPETRDWNEDTTRRLIIDLALQRAGWPLDQERRP